MYPEVLKIDILNEKKQKCFDYVCLVPLNRCNDTSIAWHGMEFIDKTNSSKNIKPTNKSGNVFRWCLWRRDRGAMWKVGGLTIENTFFILKIEKRKKIIVFDLFLSRDFVYFIQYLFLVIGRATYTVSSDSIQEKTRLQF